MSDHETSGGYARTAAEANSVGTAGILRGRDAVEGPLVVSKKNPRYFAVATGDGGEGGQAVYLVGSHIWNNFHDGMGPGPDCSDEAEEMDYGAYLRFLKEHGHNFIRLWRWEQFKSQAAGGGFHLCMTPQPWPRSGAEAAGMAKDGKPKFDLSKFDQGYFDRLRLELLPPPQPYKIVSMLLEKPEIRPVVHLLRLIRAIRPSPGAALRPPHLRVLSPQLPARSPSRPHAPRSHRPEAVPKRPPGPPLSRPPSAHRSNSRSRASRAARSASSTR